MLFEWAVDVLKRTKNVDDKEEIISNVASTKMDTIVVPLDTERVRALPIWQSVSTIIYNLAIALLAINSVK